MCYASPTGNGWARHMFCKIPGCGAQMRANGLCNKHNLRRVKYGDPLGGVRNHAPPEERFWRRVERGHPEACWLWTGKIERNGYGRFQVGGKGSPQVGAHRYSYEMHNEPPPPGLVVMHKCDVRNCVNPRHLTLGTHADNMADMMAKGRKMVVSPIGESSGAAKLTDELVRAMRLSSESHAAWAERVGLARSTVRAARLGKTWGHIDTPPSASIRRYRTK